MSTPTITTQLLREAATGTNPAAENDLLRGATHIARAVARGFSRVDAEDLTGELVTELITARPIGLPGAAWTIARTLAGALNVVEQVAGAASLGTIRRGNGLATVADGLGVQPDEEGRLRLPHSASVNALQEEYGYDPEAAPMINREPAPPSQRLTEELIDRVAAEMGWTCDVATRAVTVLAHAMDGMRFGTGHDLLTERIAQQLIRPARTRPHAREACVPDHIWREFVRKVFRSVLPLLGTQDLGKAA